MVGLSRSSSSSFFNDFTVKLMNGVVTRRMLKDNEKKDYIRAVNCLQRIKSKANPKDFPGVRSRYDDFIATHITHSRGFIEQTGGIHLVVRLSSSQFFPT